MRTNIMPFSVYGIPLVGLVGMLICLWHPQYKLQPDAVGPEMVFLVSPDPQLDKSRIIFLRREAEDVAVSRKSSSLDAQAKAIADYNLIANECTPEVFRATHLPLVMAS